MKPIIAIVGRPNVGKSTLFNRIIGQRKALTLDQPGVTRDRHYGTATWEGRDFDLIDTGGIPLEKAKTAGSMESKVHEQVDQAIREADLVLFVMDGQQGLLPEEQEIARSLRKFGKKIFYIINKIDIPEQKERLNDFYVLGEEIYPVSSEHGLYLNDLLDDVVRDLPAQQEMKGPKALRVAIVGRPNVGKSSLLNRLLGEKRVVVHDQPGTTRDPIDTALTIGSQNYLLVDTAGIRRGAKSASRVERYSVLAALKAVERTDICLLVLDASEGISKQDAHVAGEVMKSKKGLILIVNKWDLQMNQKGPEEKFIEKIDFSLPFLSHAPVLFISALTGAGCDDIWSDINTLYKACGKRIPTSEVNRVFEGLIGSHNPPVFKGKPVKFFYATQTKTFPPTFVAFVNEPKGVHFSFQRYLVNGFREAFDFGGAPIELHFRKKR